MLQFAVLLAVLAPQTPVHGLDQSLTLTSPGRTVVKLLEQISEKTGVRLEAAGPVADEIVVLRVVDAPLRETLDKIAAATTAEWVVDGERRTLVRTDKVLDRLRRAAYDGRVAAMESALSQLRKRLDAAPPLSTKTIESEFQREQAGMNRDDCESPAPSAPPDPPGPLPPAKRAMAQLAVDCWTAKALANLPEGEEIVYSTRPNSGQHPFPKDVGAVIRTLDRETALSTKACEALRAASGDRRSAYGTGITFMELGVADHYRSDAFDEMLAKGPSVRLLFSVRRVGDNIGFAIATGNSNGMTVVSDRLTMFRDDSDDAQSRETLFRDSKAIVVPELARRLIEMFAGSDSEVVEPSSLDRSLVDRMADPVRFEPLADAPSDLLVAIAEARAMNLVARIPDEALCLLGALKDVPPNDTGVLEVLTQCDCAVSRSDRWVVIRSPNCLASFARSNRAALGRIAQHSVSIGRVTLEDWASYIAVRGDRSGFAKAILGALGYVEFDDNTESLLTVYGLLTQEQRELLFSGKSIPLLQLSPDTRRAIDGVLADYGLSEDEESQETESPGSGEVVDFESLFRRNRAVPLSTFHWTEQLPGGIPPSATLSMSEGFQDIFLHEFHQDAIDARVYSLSELAEIVLRKRRPDLSVTDESVEDVGDLKVGTDRTVSVTVTLPNRLSIQGSLSEHAYRKGRYRIDSLPSDMKKKLDAAVEALLKERTQPDPPQAALR